MEIESALNFVLNVYLMIHPFNVLGYDAGSFSFYLKKYSLQECKEALSNNGIDCVRTFLDLNEEKMQAFGLKYGQIRKCLLAIQDISKERT